jgi:hypothetical protein
MVLRRLIKSVRVHAYSSDREVIIPGLSAYGGLREYVK